jgi:SRSO17 transposase
MTARLPVTPAPDPLEAYCRHFDHLFSQRAQRERFRRYLEGLLLPTERHKTLTALANTEPVVGASHAQAQGLQWFLSESTWDPDALTARRLELLRADPLAAPNAQGVLVIDEHGDRKWGDKTAHVGKQYLANLGKIENGVVSVTSLWADERVYYPLHVRPYTPAHHFAHGTADPRFRTKLRLAAELVGHAVALGWPFRAVVADSFYGEDRGFKEAVRALGVDYVVALKPSHAWLHPEGAIGSPEEYARAARWDGLGAPGDWTPVERSFHDGHKETWWALEVQKGPYGTDKVRRAIVATTDPTTLPERQTWYLETTLGAAPPEEGAGEPADVAEVVRLYGLRHWVEQGYKQTKYALGWSEYQVRSDMAIRRHWALVCCAFAFCWHHLGRLPTAKGDAQTTSADTSAPAGGRPARRAPRPPTPVVAGGAPGGTGVVGAASAPRPLLGGLVPSAASTSLASPP